MAENNVLRPVFGRKKTEPTNAAPPSKERGSLQDFFRPDTSDSWAGKFRIETPDGGESDKRADLAGFSTILGTLTLQDLLGKLVQRHEGKIRDYKSMVEGYSDEDLQAWLDNPKDADLQRKPYFFHALIDEAKRRFLYPETRAARQQTASDVAGSYKRTEPEDVSDDYRHIGPLEGENLERAQKDLLFMLANQDHVTAMRDKLEEAGDVIFNLPGYTPDQESIRLRREGLKTYSLADICQETEKTHQIQWRKQPSFLGALALEHHARVQTALSLMNKKEDQGPE